MFPESIYKFVLESWVSYCGVDPITNKVKVERSDVLTTVVLQMVSQYC